MEGIGEAGNKSGLGLTRNRTEPAGLVDVDLGVSHDPLVRSVTTPAIKPERFTRILLPFHTNLTPSVEAPVTLEKIQGFLPGASGQVWGEPRDGNEPALPQAGGVFRVKEETGVTELGSQKMRQVELHEDAICDLMDMRIQVFYLRLIACENTDSVFVEGNQAEYQGGRSNALVLVTDQNPDGTKVVSRHAAHPDPHSAISVEDGEGPYLYGSDYFRTFCSVLPVPSFVNISLDAFLERDRKSSKKFGPKTGIKAYGCQIINRVASSDAPLTKEAGVKLYLEHLLKLVDMYINEKKGNEAYVGAAKLYKSQCERWQRRLEQNPTWLQDRLLCSCTHESLEVREQIYQFAAQSLRCRQEGRSRVGLTVKAFMDRHFPDTETSTGWEWRDSEREGAGDPFRANLVIYLCENTQDPKLKWFLRRHFNYSDSLKQQKILVRTDTSDTTEHKKMGLPKVQEEEPQWVDVWRPDLQKELGKVPFDELEAQLQQVMEGLLEEERSWRESAVNCVVKAFELRPEKAEALRARVLGLPVLSTDSVNTSALQSLCKDLGVGMSLFFTHFDLQEAGPVTGGQEMDHLTADLSELNPKEGTVRGELIDGVWEKDPERSEVIASHREWVRRMALEAEEERTRSDRRNLKKRI